MQEDLLNRIGTMEKQTGEAMNLQFRTLHITSGTTGRKRESMPTPVCGTDSPLKFDPPFGVTDISFEPAVL